MSWNDRHRHRLRPVVLAAALVTGAAGVALVSGPVAQSAPWAGEAPAVPSASAAPGAEVPPTGPGGPVGLAGPVAPAGPAAPVAPVAPAGPVVPSGPGGSGGPGGPGGTGGSGGDLSTLVGPRSSGLVEPAPVVAVAPASLSIPVLGVFDAPVVAVGVLVDGELEVPPPSQVGWYRFGAHPGEPGSAVLAAHIAAGGRDGVFLRLGELAPGDEVTVTHVDGGVSRWQVAVVETHHKDALPAERVFATRGNPTLTLISCGGEFDPARRSYEDNVVVFARRA